MAVSLTKFFALTARKALKRSLFVRHSRFLPRLSPLFLLAFRFFARSQMLWRILFPPFSLLFTCLKFTKINTDTTNLCRYTKLTFYKVKSELTSFIFFPMFPFSHSSWHIIVEYTRVRMEIIRCLKLVVAGKDEIIDTVVPQNGSSFRGSEPFETFYPGEYASRVLSRTLQCRRNIVETVSLQRSTSSSGSPFRWFVRWRTEIRPPVRSPWRKHKGRSRIINLSTVERN